MKKLQRFFGPDGQGGQAIVMVAITFMAMMFVVGLAVDAGQLFAAKRTMQEAADAAAFAGAVVLYQGGTPGGPGVVADAIAAATLDATKNGFTQGVSNTTVTVNSPPTSGTYLNDATHIEVTIIRQVQTTLVPAEAAFNPVRARGVAGAESLNSGYAIMALDAGCTSGAFTTTLSENVHLYGGGLFINSCSTTALQGMEDLEDFQICALLPAPCLPNPYTIDLVGQATGSTIPSNLVVRTGVAPRADPFAGYPRPRGLSYNGVATLPTNPAPIAGSTTYPEGIYSVGPFSNLSICHGIYVLKGIGFGGGITADTTRTDPNTSTPCDGKALIFNTTATWPAATPGPCANMGATGGPSINLSPMTTGMYAYFGIYQDPACTSGDLSITGVATLNMGGTIYLPTGKVILSGDPSSIFAGQIIANNVNVMDGTLNITYNPATNAQPRLPRLAE